MRPLDFYNLVARCPTKGKSLEDSGWSVGGLLRKQGPPYLDQLNSLLRLTSFPGPKGGRSIRGLLFYEMYKDKN